MLSDNQLEYIGAEFAALFQQMEQDIIKDVARRVAKTSRWTETAELQAGALREMGYSPAEIYRSVLEKLGADSEYRTLVRENTIEHKQMVTETIKRTVEEAKAKGDDLVSQAGNMAFRNDMSLWRKGGKVLMDSSPIKQIVRFYQTQLTKEVGGLTGSTGFVIKGEKPIPTDDIYHKELDRMLTNVTSGAFTTEQAIQESMKRMTQSGVRYVHFDSGVSRNIDTAMRLAIQTTSSQMAGSITVNNLSATGEDLVEVSSHAGARNDGIGCMNHASWQGKVYSISGAPHEEESKRLGYKIQKLEDVTGYPSDPTGLCGYNCRHTFHVFFEGISEPDEPEKEPEPFVWHGKIYDHYHARQKQRQMEREIREVKRKVACGVEKQMALLTNKELQYRTFCEYAGLTMNIGRLDVVNARKSLWLLKDKVKSERNELKILIEKALNRKKDIEPEITDCLQSTASGLGASLYGLEFRFKSLESLQRKVISDSKELGITEQMALSKINDILRYTIISGEANFTKNYFNIIDKLRIMGYDLIRVKNTFKGGAKYKGINVVINYKGESFELQFHTPDSMAVKEGELHKLYEKCRVFDADKDREKIELLNQKMINLSSKIKNPLGVEYIK